MTSLGRCMVGVLFSMSTVAAGAVAAEPSPRLNVLLITVDDMNYDAPGFAGCKVPGITPNLDKLASQSMRFVNGHITIAVCQPSRSALMTGRYPSRNGAMGFQPIREDVPTLTEQLRAAGYLNGILGKVDHLQPQVKFCWDMVLNQPELGNGRDPAKYYAGAKAFLEKAREAGKPFFLMANSHDPHRPFAGSEQESHPGPRRSRKAPADYPEPERTYSPAEILLPDFLPDLPDVRKEVAQYYSSVRRSDQTVGEILRALAETGFEANTLVMFLSDNGMAFPFAKTNCYLASTRTPWLVRWPGRVKPGVVNDRDFISGIDFMPTILEATGLSRVEGMDGRSFVPLLRGQEQEDRDRVFTVFHRTAGRNDYPMRAVQDRRFGYIVNAWSDGQTVFKNESQAGLTFKAMQAAAAGNEQVAARVKLFQYRVPEEFYDFQADPAALHNLIDDPELAEEIAKFRAELLRTMRSIDDPDLPVFEKVLSKPR